MPLSVKPVTEILLGNDGVIASAVVTKYKQNYFL